MAFAGVGCFWSEGCAILLGKLGKKLCRGSVLGLDFGDDGASLEVLVWWI